MTQRSGWAADLLHSTVRRPSLALHRALLLDGALATELERRGADLNHPLWSAKLLLEAPERIEQIHYDYFMHGADVATTATYQATLDGFARLGIGEMQGGALMLQSVDLALAARARFWREPAHRRRRTFPLIAASIGPYGAFLADGSEYRGNYGCTSDELKRFHRRRLQLLAHSRADLLACETIPCIDEAQALVELLDEIGAKPAWLSFSCRDDEHLHSGERFADAVDVAMQSAWVCAVGVNCTAPRHVPALLRQAAARTALPLLAYPNRGEDWDAGAHSWAPGTGIANWAQAALMWRAAGAAWIGGCCRSTPADVGAMADVLGPRYQLDATRTE